MDGTVAWRAALIQGGAVAAAALVLGAALPRSFFADFGWVAGPGVWGACAVLCATVLRLPVRAALAGAAVAGLPSLAAVLAGVHWLGVPLAVALFALWCGRLAARGRRRPARSRPGGVPAAG